MGGARKKRIYYKNRPFTALPAFPRVTIMLERDLTAKIMRYLKAQPALFCWKQAGGQFGCSGLPDIICCLNGRFVAFEVKRPAGGGQSAGKLTKLQEIAIAKIQAAGGVAVMVTSLDEVKEIISKITEEKPDWKRT